MPSRTRLLIAACAVAIIAVAYSGRGYRVEQFGYSPDPEGARAFAQSLPTPTFAAAAPDAMARATPKEVYLWRSMDAAHRKRYGSPFKPSNQLHVGSCVSHGAAHAVFCSESVSWALGERDEVPYLVHQGAIYGGSRVEARGKPGDGAQPYGGYSDGSTGYHAARWLREWGVIYKRAYPSVDCSVSNPDIEKSWGAFGCGGEGDRGRLDAEAKKTPCLHVAQVRTWDEIVAALTSGNAVTLASSQGFTKTLDHQSFAAPSGIWMHQMAAIGLRTDRPGVAIINSWGNYLTYTAPRYPHDLPDGVFWADKRVIEGMLAQGDCWAVSETAFKYREINHNEWLGAK